MFCAAAVFFILRRSLDLCAHVAKRRGTVTAAMVSASRGHYCLSPLVPYHPPQAGRNLKIDDGHQTRRRVIPDAVRNEALFGERGRESPDFYGGHAVNQGIDIPRSPKACINSNRTRYRQWRVAGKKKNSL